eukprot:14958958-Ditylum_brightwellii.AAC.1
MGEDAHHVPFYSCPQEPDCGVLVSLFTTLHCTKVPSGDPLIPVEVREAKLAWLQICARSECSTGLSNEEEDGEIFSSVEEEEEDNDTASQELLGLNMAQLISTLPKKEAIKLENEDISKFEDVTDISAFENQSFKKAK